MRKQLLFALLTMITIGTMNAQITSVGLIGSATPNGWDADTNMVQDVDSAHLWTMSIALVDGEAKFRADDDWAVNWGSDKFPFGTGEQDGANIPIVAGDYMITFNSNTGEYFFDYMSNIGVLGSAAPFGWDRDVNMVPDSAGASSFSVRLDLAAGEVKFRQDDDWAVNWGNTGFPTDTAFQDGPNIPIAQAGDYLIQFDTSTGIYNFTQFITYSSIGIIGDATPGGWDTETGLNQDPNNPDLWTGTFVSSGGGLLFSIDSSSTFWGGGGFPADTAVAENPDTIMVPAGKWKVTVMSNSPATYLFEAVIIYETVGIIGDATPGGWSEDTDMDRSSADSSQWTLRLILGDGEAKFRANDDWGTNWGAGDFPSGTATLDGANIPITAGEYIISFNSFTGDYDFKELIVYDTMGLVGSGSPTGSWDDDTFMTKTEDNENMWFIPSATLTDGEVKFRANANWTVNWGADSWPNGVGTQDGPNIQSVAGNWGVTLNDATGEYAFGDEISSTEDILDPSSILAYPNPTSDELNIDISEIEMHGEVLLSVFNMSGQLIKSERRMAESIMQMNVSSLADGHYLLRISNEDYIIGKRFVVVGN